MYEGSIKRLVLYSIKFRRMSCDLIEIYNVFVGLKMIDAGRICSLTEETKNRGHRLKIRGRPDIRRNFF